MKRKWKDKLSSRKFQAAAVVIITALAIAVFGQYEVERIIALLATAATALGYCFAEAKCDAQHIDKDGEHDG